MTVAPLAPMVRNTAISAFFDRTSMIIDEMILNAATRMINVRIRNMTLRSTRKALINVRLRCTQSKTRKLSLTVSATSTRVVVIICGSAV